MANFFDQFDGSSVPSQDAGAPVAGKNYFDQFDGPGAPEDQTAGQSPGILKGVSDAATRAFTMGLSQPVAGLASVLVNYPADLLEGQPTKSFADYYKAGIATQNASDTAFSNAHPIASAFGMAAGTAGGVGPFSSMKTAATLLGRMTQGAGLGGLLGGISGAANADPENSGRDALIGGGMGAATGGAFPVVMDAISPALEAVARKVSSSAVQNQAASRIAQAIQQDTQAGGPGLTDITNDLTQAGGKPLVIADVAGENVRGLAGEVARKPGPARAMISTFLTDRDAAAGPRLIGDINQMLSNGGDAYTIAQDLIQQRSAATSPLYQQAFAENPTVDVSKIAADLDQRLQTAKGPIAAALQKARGLLNAPNGSLDTSLSGLHETKLALDDLISNARDNSIGNVAKRELVGIKNALLEEMDNASPTYAQARAAFSGPSASLDAVDEGRQIFNKSPAQIAQEMQGVSDSDKDFYRLGAADALRVRIAKTGQAGNEARQIIGNDYLKSQLRALFDSQQQYDSFIQAATNESKMFGTTYDVLGNSKTAARMAQDNEAAQGALGHFATAAGAFAAHEPIYGLVQGGRGIGALFGNLRSASPEVNEQIARMLFSPDGNQSALSLIQGRLNPPNRLLGAQIPLATSFPQLLGRYTGETNLLGGQ